MQIVAFHPDSFQEYEDYHAIVLFCKGCNFNCYGCYNYDTIQNKQPIGSAEDILLANVNPMHEAVVFLGGEPTIWEQMLVSSAQFARTMNLKIKVYTNGFQPDVIKNLIEYDALDALSVDLKCVDNCKVLIGKDIRAEQYLKVVGRTIDMARMAEIPVEIRTTEFDGIDIKPVKVYVEAAFPGVRHIIQRDFRPMLDTA